MSEIADFITAQYRRIEQIARAATDGPWAVDSESYAEAIRSADGTDVVAGGRWGDEASVFESTEDAAHIALHDPQHILADVESKRQVIREVMSWRHDVVDGDCWFTCGAATEERDGGECCNDNQRNECTCGLDDRREKILSLLAAPFSGEPGYDAERWAV